MIREIKLDELESLSAEFQENGYVHIKNFFTPEFVDYVRYSIDKLIDIKDVNGLDYDNDPDVNTSYVDTPDNVNNSVTFYSPFMFDTLGSFITCFYNELAKRSLGTTYTFVRRYNKYQKLVRHIDRPSCQFSMTADFSISDNQPWDFFVETYDLQVKSISVLSGDVIFYKGVDIPHWREELTTRDQSYHAFFHWVDLDSPIYRDWVHDTRPDICYPFSSVIY